MILFRKLGLVYEAPYDFSWRHFAALAPTPILLADRIRVFCGFRDPAGVSRIGYVDVKKNNPTEVIEISSNPVLDVGVPGSFDDNGLNLGDLICVDGVWRMYYVGYQIVEKVKFLAFTGLACSYDNACTFERLSKSPVMDRSDEGLYIRGIHSIVQSESGNGGFDCWYSTGSHFEEISGKPFPYYHTSYQWSSDGINFSSNGKVCLSPSYPEYRLGRARVFQYDNRKLMFFTVGARNGSYLCELAEYIDDKWHRIPKSGIVLSPNGWDSRHLCYPAVINIEDQVYAFYNGNDMGKDGFGVAVLET